MPKDYALPPDISRMNFLNLLEHLKDDANDHFTSLACSYTLRESTVDKSKAMFYAGQMDLLSSIIWAMSGTAENDGCDATISIKRVEDL